MQNGKCLLVSLLVLGMAGCRQADTHVQRSARNQQDEFLRAAAGPRLLLLRPGMTGVEVRETLGLSRDRLPYVFCGSSATGFDAYFEDSTGEAFLYLHSDETVDWVELRCPGSAKWLCRDLRTRDQAARMTPCLRRDCRLVGPAQGPLIQE